MHHRRTVLRTYDDDHGRRAYPVTLDYSVNLCGLGLKVEKSLAFQEQDTILAACATVALWSCFQKTADLFHTRVPSPAAITRAATQFTHHGRPIPSHGLIVTEICAAIRHVGLEPELFEVRRGLPLASLLYGYLRMGLPVILGIETKGRGGHAIALTGYSKCAEPTRKAERGAGLPMRGLRVDAFYGHDDQAGPFSRLNICPGQGSSGDVFESPGYADEGTGERLELRPTVVVVPVYHKIRITFLDVQEWLTKVHRLFAVWLRGVHLEWDVRLCSANQYKTDLQEVDWVPAGMRDAGLRADLPRFLWRATLYSNERVAADFLFDATSLARTLPLISVSWLGEALSARIEVALSSEGFGSAADELLTPRFCQFLKESLARRPGRGAGVVRSE